MRLPPSAWSSVIKRLSPPPQATRMPCFPAESTVPGAASAGPPGAVRNTLNRRPASSQAAQGQGIRPRTWQSISRAERVQSMGDISFVSMEA